MEQSPNMSYIAFAGSRRVASGNLVTVARVVSEQITKTPTEPVLIFDDMTSRLIELDLRGSADDVVARLRAHGTADAAASPEEVADGSPYRDEPAARGRGRPKLGVIAREVTLLPRHWDWLATQPGGASAAVRRLVDAARQTHAASDRRREAQDAAYRFMSAMAGNETGFEEATRALFAGDEPRFTSLTAEWPRDVRDHARVLAGRAFAPVPAA
jgi:hypothetical protein